MKERIRERVWDRLDSSGEARFPFPVSGRIPNFAGSAQAARRLTETDHWTAADAIKTNPDYAQFPVRTAALEAGKDIYMAVPRLADTPPFLHLDPDAIEDLEEAATISGAQAYGTPTKPEDLPQTDLVVVGSVAVTEDGVRIGKGEGYSDLEFAILREYDRVTRETPVVTTVHEQQVIDDEIEPDAHDVPLSAIYTPNRTIEPAALHAVPSGIDWSILDADDIASMPVLQDLADA